MRRRIQSKDSDGITPKKYTLKNLTDDLKKIDPKLFFFQAVDNKNFVVMFDTRKLKRIENFMVKSGFKYELKSNSIKIPIHKVK